MRKFWRVAIPVLLLVIPVFYILKNPIARKNNEKGLQYYNKSEFDKAEKYFLRAVFWKSRYQEGLINLVKCQLEQQQFEQSGQTLNRLVKLSPDEAETLGLQGQQKVLLKDFQGALEKLNESIAKDSSLAYAYFYRGIANTNLGLLEAAAEDYLKAQILDKTNKDALEKRAIVLSRLNNFEAAIANYDKLLELDPSNTMAFFQRGNLKMQIGEFPGAVDDFTQTIILNNTLPEAYYNRGKSYANLNKFAEAISDFNRSAELQFKIPGSLYNAGFASLKMNDTKKAKEYLLRCITIDKKNEQTSKVYQLLGVIEMMQNNNKASIGYFNRSIKLDSTFSDAFYNRGIAFGIIKEYQKAIHDLNKCIELGNTSSDVYFARGVNLISLSNYSAGCLDLTKAEELGHQQASAMKIQYCKQYP